MVARWTLGLAVWTGGLALWTASATLLAQPYGASCGCPGACGCGAGLVPPPGPPASPYYDEFREPYYDERYAPTIPGEPSPYRDQPSPYTGEPSVPTPSPEPATDLQLSQQFGGGGQFFVTNYSPPSIGDSFTPSVKVFASRLDTSEPLCVPLPSGSAVLGRAKLADNNSPLPRDRIFFDYNYFNNANLIPGGIDAHRFSPGFESTFLDGMMSVEMRVPMVLSVDSDLVVDGVGNYLGNVEDAEMGNVQFMWKTLLVENPWGVLGGGIAVTVPTANDVTVRFEDGTPLFQIENEAVHLMPYVALLRMFGPNVFFLTSAQLDFGLNGNPVHYDNGNGQLTRIGKLDDQTLLYFDTTLGAWLYRDPRAPVLNGLALAMEAHYTASLEDMPSIATPDILVGDPNQDLNMVNLTCGAHLALGPNMVTLGYGFPVTGDRVFDGEIRFFINRFY